MWGLNWGKGTGTGTETGVMDETCIIGFAPPFGVTTVLVGERVGIDIMCLVLDKVSAVNLGCQITRPSHIPRKQFSCLLRW